MDFITVVSFTMRVTCSFSRRESECLFEGLKNIFEHIGGVPPWFDNASNIKAFKGWERKLTDAFLRFKQHYALKLYFATQMLT